jgi:hypothetical protein
MADDVSFKFGADIKDLQAKLDQVGGMFKQFGEQFAVLTAAVAGGAAFKKFIDAANEAAVSSEKISRTLGITTDEAQILRVALDDVAAQLGDGSVNADTYTGAFLKFNRQLRMNSDTLRAYGVDVDAIKNGTKTSNQVFQEAIAIVGKYAPGIDQTQAAMQLFGRSVSEVQALMKITPEAMEEARKHAQSLNLTLSQESVDASRAYRKAMNDVHDVLEGVEKTIGEAVIPHFTTLAQQLSEMGPTIVQGAGAAIQIMITLWDELADTVATVWDGVRGILEQIGEAIGITFGKDGPGAMDLFRNAVRVVQIAIIGFSVGFQEFVNLVATGLQMLVAGVRMYVDIWVAALHFDWEGVKQAWKDGLAERNRILQEATDKALDIANKGREKLDTAANASMGVGGGKAAGSAGGAGTKRATIGKDTSGQDARLAAQLALQRAMQEAAMALQLEYLKQAGSMYDQAYQHGLISLTEYYASKLQIEQQANSLQLATRRQELADAQAAEAKAQAKASDAIKPQDRTKAEAEVIKFRTEQVKIQGQINVLEAQSLDITRRNANDKADAVQKQTAALQAILDTSAKTTADNEVAAERAALDQKKALRQISAQGAFKIEQNLEEESYAAAVANIAARRSLITGSQEEQRQQHAQLDAEAEAAEQQHQLKLTQIHNAAEQEREKYSVQAQQTIEAGFATFLNDMMSKTKTLGDAFRSMASSIASAFENLIAKKFAERMFESSGVNKAIDSMVNVLTGGIDKMIANWVAGEAAKTTASAAGAAERSVIETTASATSKTLTIGDALMSIGARAAQAAASVYASIAAIPYVGPFLAPAAAGAAMVTVLGFGKSIMSAEGGMESVPFDGAMAQLHKKEMVLPRFLSEGVRQIAEPGRLQSLIAASVNQAQQSHSAGGDTYNLTVHALDAPSVKQLFERHGPALVSSLKKQGRNFAF